MVDGTNVVRNTLMFAAVCGGLPAMIGSIMSHMDIETKSKNKWVIECCMLVFLPLLLALSAAVVGVYSCKVGEVIFSIACGVLLFFLGNLSYV